jgi:hypothetical protein
LISEGVLGGPGEMEMQLKDASAVLGTWVSISAAIVAGYVALQSWQDQQGKRIDERVAYAFHFVEEFHRPEMVRVRTLLRQAQDQRPQRNGTDEISCVENPAEGLGISPPEVFALVEFFDRANMCVEVHLCDSETLTRLIGPHAESVQMSLMYHLMVQRREHPSYGQGLEALGGAISPESEAHHCSQAQLGGRARMLRSSPD